MAKPDPKEWASIEECIEHVIRSRSCSRRTARRIVTAHIKAKHLEAKYFRQKCPPVGIPLTPAEASKKLDAGEDHNLLVTFAEFARYFKMTWEEMQVELRAGRLVGGASESAILEMELTNRINPNQWVVTVEAIKEWIHNPETPPELFQRAGSKIQ